MWDRYRWSGQRGVNAFTTGNPLGAILLEVSVGRDFGALKGLSRALLGLQPENLI